MIFQVLCWRDVPVRTEYLVRCAGHNAEDPPGPGVDVRMPSRRRWSGGSIWRGNSLSGRHERGDVTGYICSLSSQTIVYKAICTAIFCGFLSRLASEDFVTPLRSFTSDMQPIPCPHGIAPQPEERSGITARSIRSGAIGAHDGSRLNAAGGVQARTDAGWNGSTSRTRRSSSCRERQNASRSHSYAASASAAGHQTSSFLRYTPTAQAMGWPSCTRLQRWPYRRRRARPHGCVLVDSPSLRLACGCGVRGWSG